MIKFFSDLFNWFKSLFKQTTPSIPEQPVPVPSPPQIPYPEVMPIHRFNRTVFFDVVRASLGKLTQSQVDGFNRILDEFDRRPKFPKAQLPYVLATGWWETGRTMQPVREAFYVSKDFAKAEAWRRSNLRYYPYYGRGDVQLTWLDNYKKASALYGKDFVKNPDGVMDPVISAKIIFDGMDNGWFTGKKLDDYIDEIDEPETEDLREFMNARRIVNGTDKAASIGKLALIFEKAVK